MLANKCSPTGFLDAWATGFAELHVFVVINGIPAMKHIHQDGVSDVEPYSPKLRFISPQHTTKDVFRPSRYKAGIKCKVGAKLESLTL